jgi:hypothetical protein
MTPQALVPALMAPLLAFVIYRRVRRNIGRQRLEPARLRTRIVVLAIATGMIVFNIARTADMQLAMALGALPGIALAFWGVQLTRFETTPQGRFYTPNAYLGFAVSALLIARIAYRLVQVWPAMQSPQSAAAMNASPAALYSPLTMGMLGLVIGYYIAYCAGLIWRARDGSTAAA